MTDSKADPRSVFVIHTTALKPGKVVKANQKVKVGIRAERYQDLKGLWEAINAKYYLRLDELSLDEIDSCIDAILDKGIYRPMVGRFAQDTIVNGDELGFEVQTETKRIFDVSAMIPYGEWLKLAHKQTHLPIDRIHAGLVRQNSKAALKSDFFNKATLGEFVAKFTEWMERTFLTRFSYARIDGLVSGTTLTDADGRPLENVVQGRCSRRGPSSFRRIGR